MVHPCFVRNPICPGDSSFEITSPVFDEITFNLDTRYASAPQFKVIAHDNSPENVYIAKAVLNGKELEKLNVLSSWSYGENANA